MSRRRPGSTACPEDLDHDWVERIRPGSIDTLRVATCSRCALSRVRLPDARPPHVAVHARCGA